MTAYTLTIDVRDFDAATGTAPKDARLEIARAELTVAGDVIVSRQAHTVRLTDGHGTAQLEGGTAYRFLFRSVRGLSAPFLARMPSGATTAAALYSTGQIDPGTLQPLPTFQTVAEAFAALRASVDAILAGSSAQFDSFLEIANRMGLDEATVTALTALVAGKAAQAALDAEIARATSAEAGAAQRTANLSDLASAATARTNLGLGNVSNTADSLKPVSTAQAAADAAATAAAQASSAQRAANLSDLASAATARTNLGLGSAALQPVSAFDSAGAAAAVAASTAATYATLAQQLLGWGYTQSFRLVSATRDANEAITTASVVWPDGATGTFTTDTASTAFPGAIDAYHVTHVLAGTTLTVTQAAVTRDAGGAVTAQPALVVA